MKEQDIRKRDVFNRYLEMVSEDTEKFFKTEKFVLLDCPACNSGLQRHEFRKCGFNYVSCQECGTLFVNPRPSTEELKKFYAEAPSSRYWVEEFFKPVAEARRIKIFRPRAEYVKSIFPCLSGKVVGDIGSGFGLFLEELRAVSPANRFVAIEPSPEMAAICAGKGFEAIEDCLENVDDKYNGTFFLLTGFELFEHLARPSEFLEKVNALLAPGGYFVLTTLNGQGFDIQVLWERSKSVSPPHHLNFFNPGSIVTLLRDTGFAVKEVATPGKLDWDILEGAYRNDAVEIARFFKTVADNGTQDAKNALQLWIASYNFSSHMRVVAQKIS